MMPLPWPCPCSTATTLGAAVATRLSSSSENSLNRDTVRTSRSESRTAPARHQLDKHVALPFSWRGLRARPAIRRVFPGSRHREPAGHHPERALLPPQARRVAGLSGPTQLAAPSSLPI